VTGLELCSVDSDSLRLVWWTPEALVDEANKEYPPPSDIEDEKMYRDVDEVESFGVKAPVLAGRLRALLEHLASPPLLGTGSRKSHVQGGWSSNPSQRFSSDPAFRLRPFWNYFSIPGA
jgi:hypothetical protein